MRSVRTIEYTVVSVTDLMDLLDCMRYDSMRFMASSDGKWEATIRALAARSCGIVSTIPGDGTIVIAKDQHKDWKPTSARWQSFGMQITANTRWDAAREIA